VSGDGGGELDGPDSTGGDSGGAGQRPRATARRGATSEHAAADEAYATLKRTQPLNMRASHRLEAPSRKYRT
jgi:hypothetical protein